MKEKKEEEEEIGNLIDTNHYNKLFESNNFFLATSI